MLENTVLPHAHWAGVISCTTAGGKRAWRCPACPGFPPALRGVAGAEHWRGFLEGGGLVLVEPGLQRFDMCAKLREVVLHGAQIRLDQGWRVLPVLLRKGKRPSRAVRSSGLIHRSTRRRQWMPIRALLITEKWTGVEHKMPERQAEE